MGSVGLKGTSFLRLDPNIRELSQANRLGAPPKLLKDLDVRNSFRCEKGDVIELDRKPRCRGRSSENLND
jgi:hypothetical protein